MTVAPNVEILADHSLWLAVPAFAPAVVVAGIVVYIAMKNRRQGDDPHSESPSPASEDKAP